MAWALYLTWSLGYNLGSNPMRSHLMFCERCLLAAGSPILFEREEKLQPQVSAQ
jgi:hypothetical protein